MTGLVCRSYSVRCQLPPGQVRGRPVGIEEPCHRFTESHRFVMGHPARSSLKNGSHANWMIRLHIDMQILNKMIHCKTPPQKAEFCIATREILGSKQASLVSKGEPNCPTLD